VVPGGHRQAAGLPPAREPSEGETRIDGVAYLGAQPQPFHHTWAKALDQPVAGLEERLEDGDVVLVLEVELDRALAPVEKRLFRIARRKRGVLAMHDDHIRTVVR